MTKKKNRKVIDKMEKKVFEMFDTAMKSVGKWFTEPIDPRLIGILRTKQTKLTDFYEI